MSDEIQTGESQLEYFGKANKPYNVKDELKALGLIPEPMTPARMMEIEPRLKLIEEYILFQNKYARGNNKFFSKHWSEAKRRQQNLVGWFARKKELQHSGAWDTWHEHLKNISTNLK